MSWERFRSLPGWGQAAVWVLLAPIPLLLLTLTRQGRSRVAWGAVTGAVALLWVSAVAGAVSGEDQTTEEAATTSTTTGATSASGGTSRSGDDGGVVSTTRVGGAGSGATATSTGPVTVGTSPPASVDLGGLRVAAEGPRAGYDRDLFDHWSDADGDRCDTETERNQGRRQGQDLTLRAGEQFSAGGRGRGRR